MRRFQTAPGNDRYLWDPRVHERFEEACYYYIIRALDPNDRLSVSRAVAQIVRAQDIGSGSVYSLFGFYDVLLRMWATETVRRRFLRALHSSDLIEVDDIRDFRAEHIVYSFAERTAPPVEEIRVLDPQILLVEQAELNDSWDNNPEAERAFAELMELGCIHLVPPVEQGLKFYLVLERTKPRVLPLEHEQAQISAQLQTAGFQCTSIYSGKGTFADHLVKGVGKDFSDLYSQITPIRQAGRRLFLRSMTLPLANVVDGIETDQIDQLRVRSDPTIEDLLDDLGREFDETGRKQLRIAAGALTISQRNALSEIYEEFNPAFLNTPFRPKFLATISGSLLRDIDRLDATVSFFNAIERDLRRLLPKILRDERGDTDINWYNVLRSLIETEGLIDQPSDDDEAGVDDEGPGEPRAASFKGFESLTLRELLDVARLASKQWPEVGDVFTSWFYAGWEGDIRLLWSLRNDVNHGRFLDRSDFSEFDGSWGKDLQRLYLAGKIFNGLQGMRLRYSSVP